MDIGQQNQIARRWGFKLGMPYRMQNGGEVIPLEIWERAFDGSQMVSYNARAKGEREYQRGDTTPNSLLHMIR